MSSNEQPRISVAANKAITGGLFGLAIVTFITRTYIRTAVLRQFSTEDALLLFAVICLMAATGLVYASLQASYDVLEVLESPSSEFLFKVLSELPKVSKYDNAWATLIWFVIFPVKLAYLFFFHRLISRLRTLNIWWRCAMPLTIAAGLVCIAVAWTTCPYFTVQGALSCAGTNAINSRTLRNNGIAAAMDMATDVIILSFPICLLYKVRLGIRQKIGIALSSCLSAVMIIFVISRLAGVALTGGIVDVVWAGFWQQQEGSIAVIMVSVSAFRSFFVAKNASRNKSPANVKMSTISDWSRRARGWAKGRKEESMKELPQIPRAVFTGMGTANREAGMGTVTTIWTGEGRFVGERVKEPLDWPLGREAVYNEREAGNRWV